MKIKITYIHNAQAIKVKGSDWKIAFRNQQEFNYWNYVLNGGKVKQWSNEQIEGSRGNY